MAKMFLFKCDICGAEKLAPIEEGAVGWGSLDGMHIRDDETGAELHDPLLCPDHMRPLINLTISMLEE